MASIIQKAKQQLQKAKKQNNSEVIEVKIAKPLNVKAPKDEEDWYSEYQEGIDLSVLNDEPKKNKQEEQLREVHTQKVDNVTWGDTKQIDDLEAIQVSATQNKIPDQNKQKKVVTSWVPQLRSESVCSPIFQLEQEYFPEIDENILTQKQEKPKCPTVQKLIQQTNQNPPKFVSSIKGGFKALELTEQEKKLLTIDNNTNHKEYSRIAATHESQNGGMKAQEESSFKESSYFSGQSQPPKFIGKKSSDNPQGNFKEIQKSQIDLKLEAIWTTQDLNKNKHEQDIAAINSCKIQDTRLSDSIFLRKEISQGNESTSSKPKFINMNKNKPGPIFKPLEQISDIQKGQFKQSQPLAV